MAHYVKKVIEGLDIKLNVSNWKLHAATAALEKSGFHPSAMATKINKDVKNGVSVEGDLVESAFNACVNGDKSLIKKITHLGYLRFELLLIISNRKDQPIEPQVFNAVSKALNYVPVSNTEYCTCEIQLRNSIRSLLDDEEIQIHKHLHTSELHVGKCVLSNQSFNLIKIGRDLDKTGKHTVERLLKAQSQILKLLPLDRHIAKVAALEKNVLKIAHWQPNTLEDINKTLNDALAMLDKLTWLIEAVKKPVGILGDTAATEAT